MSLALVIGAGALGHHEHRVANIRIEVPKTGLLDIIIIRIIAVSIFKRHERSSAECVCNIVPIEVADTDTALCAVCVSHVLSESDYIEVALAENHMLRVEAHCSTTVL